MALVHEPLIGYLEDPYLEGPYLGGTNGAHLPAQFEVVVADSLKTTNAQFEAIIDATKITNAQFFKGVLTHKFCESGYLEGDYLEQGYLAERYCVSLPAQFEVLVEEEKILNAQFEAQIVDFEKILNAQFEGRIDYQNILNAQFTVSITNLLNAQFQVVLYNSTQLRILCDFASRGLTIAEGGSGGNNWTAKIGAGDVTAPGDFSASNLNTDIVEERWQSTNGSIGNVNLDCDSEIPQGVTIDTLAILDHNISPGGILNLQGSDLANFSVINVTIPLPVTEENIYYIAPTFPTSIAQNRYWRFNINDPVNQDNFLRIGTIIFGNSIILSQNSCVTDKVRRKRRHFADSIRTESFTTASNDRALKRQVTLNFKDLKFGTGDFSKLDDIFRVARTSLKCLWVPYPQIPDRFAVFGKLTDLPEEEHNDKSTTDIDLDYINFTITIDESF